MKLIILKDKSICYNSTAYFTKIFSENLIDSGIDVQIIDPLKESLEATSADVILGFNFNPANILFPDNIPFVNYLLDHPLYHHEILKCKIHNYNVICLDKDHQDYIKKYYKNINSVLVLPLAGITSDKIVEYKNRKYNISFAGTYTDPDAVMNVINKFDSEYSKNIHILTDYLISHPDSTLENALFLQCEDYNRELFPIAMHSLYPVDMYITAYYRKLLIATLLKAGIKVNVFGSNWINFNSKYKQNLIIHDERDYVQTGDIAADSKIYLNVMPWFKSGIHDRVFTAMQNGAISLTDGSNMIDSYFTNKKDIVLYTLSNIEQCPEIYFDLINNPLLAENIASNGKKFISENYTYYNSSSLLADFLFSLIM